MSEEKYAGVAGNGVLFDRDGRRLALEFVTGKSIPRQCFGDKAYVLRAYNISPKQYDEAMALYYEDDTFFFKHTTLMPGVVDGVWKLHCANYHIAVISMCAGLPERRLEILCKKFKLPIKEFHSLQNAVSKVDFYAQCNLVIDDTIGHLTPLVNLPHVTPILMIPPDGGTGSDVIGMPIGLDSRIRIGRGWDGIAPYLPKAAMAA